ncbi:hypothetical protein PLICRDRAFT_110268 [Plicaturopsis crispa FD-325 SS-3]|nr:hypothetical protein PLICRDRAFT_110268 [Plicaturopsis crispa FD-325 SS-3]
MSTRPEQITVLGEKYSTDSMTNITPAIIAKLDKQLHNTPPHPLHTLRTIIEAHFHDYNHLSTLSPVVTPYQNFDSLLIPEDHPGRSVTDSYYINKNTMLRTHTSAHEAEIFRDGKTKWLLTADVYRRDEIDASHYPVFHQMEGARIFDADAATLATVRDENTRLAQEIARHNVVVENISHSSPSNPVQASHDPEHVDVLAENLKLTLTGLLLRMFTRATEVNEENPLRIRWIEAYFPFTSPSYEVEVFFGGKWLEILGCGVLQQDILNRANTSNKIGWAFGLGLERIAMVLYSIPDIRLFWSEDPRFLGQFQKEQIKTFEPFSKYPSTWRDVSFWTVADTELHENDFCDLVRDVAGDLVEDVRVIDRFTHPKTRRTSLCWRIHYRSLESRSLTNDEVNVVQERVVSRLKDVFRVEIR